MIFSVQRSLDPFTVALGAGSVGAWVSGKLRLLLEWVTLPLLLTAMQLPHGAVLYWLTSSSLALAQHLALRSAAMRAAVGLPPWEQVRFGR